jgi:zinc finger-like protein
VACSARLATYYCSICHLWDDEPGRAIYHCPFCNVCRRGQGLGIDFFHCMQCNACMSLSLFNTHTCRWAACRGVEGWHAQQLACAVRGRAA